MQRLFMINEWRCIQAGLSGTAFLPANINSKWNTFAQVLQKEFGDFPSHNQSVKHWTSKKIKQDCYKPSLNYFFFFSPLEKITYSRETPTAGFRYFCLSMLCNVSDLPGISAQQEYEEKWQCTWSKVEIISVCIKIQAFFPCNFMHLGHWTVPTSN